DSAAARADSGRTGRMVNVNAGDWIVRMDQPYTALIRTVLAVQKFRPDDPSPYDDTGWSLDQLRHVTVHTIADSTVLTKPMQLLKDDAHVGGTVAGTGATLIVSHSGAWRSAMLPWNARGAMVSIAESALMDDCTTYAAGAHLVHNSAS